MSQARSTDPFTSKQAARTKNTSGIDLKIVEFLKEHGPSNVYDLFIGLGVKETTVSPRMTHLCEEGLIHECGMSKSEETGKDRLLYAEGPGSGTLNPIPRTKTGPRKTSDVWHFKPFTPDEIAALNEQARYIDIFTEMLNAAVLTRVS